MDHNVIAAERLVAGEEADNTGACHQAAARHGIEPTAADECEAGALSCPTCPWKGQGNWRPTQSVQKYLVPVSFQSDRPGAEDELRKAIESLGLGMQIDVGVAQRVELRPVPLSGHDWPVHPPIPDGRPYYLTVVKGSYTRVPEPLLLQLRTEGVCTAVTICGENPERPVAEIEMLVGSFGFAIAREGLKVSFERSSAKATVLTVKLPD